MPQQPIYSFTKETINFTTNMPPNQIPSNTPSTTSDQMNTSPVNNQANITSQISKQNQQNFHKIPNIPNMPNPAAFHNTHPHGHHPLHPHAHLPFMGPHMMAGPGGPMMPGFGHPASMAAGFSQQWMNPLGPMNPSPGQIGQGQNHNNSHPYIGQQPPPYITSENHQSNQNMPVQEVGGSATQN